MKNINTHAATLKKYGLDKGEEFRYMMLDRLRGECVGYLTMGDWRYHEPSRIWAQNESEQIEIMRALWHSLPTAPEWLTIEQIDEYAEQMNAYIPKTIKKVVKGENAICADVAHK